MRSSIARFQTNQAVMYLSVATKVVEYGFMTAGVTASSYAAFESLVIVSRWVRIL